MPTTKHSDAETEETYQSIEEALKVTMYNKYKILFSMPRIKIKFKQNIHL